MAPDILDARDPDRRACEKTSANTHICSHDIPLNFTVARIIVAEFLCFGRVVRSYKRSYDLQVAQRKRLVPLLYRFALGPLGETVPVYVGAWTIWLPPLWGIVALSLKKSCEQFTTSPEEPSPRALQDSDNHFRMG